MIFIISKTFSTVVKSRKFFLDHPSFEYRLKEEFLKKIYHPYATILNLVFSIPQKEFDNNLNLQLFSFDFFEKPPCLRWLFCY